MNWFKRIRSAVFFSDIDTVHRGGPGHVNVNVGSWPPECLDQLARPAELPGAVGPLDELLRVLARDATTIRESVADAMQLVNTFADAVDDAIRHQDQLLAYLQDRSTRP
jgi:hypothetical protein